MKKLATSVLIGLTTIATLVSCGGNEQKTTTTKEKLSGELSLSGAFALYPLAVEWAKSFQELHPEVKVDVSAGGGGKGMTDVLAGVVDFGMVSREVYPQEIEKGAIGFPVAKDAVVPTINAANPLIKEILAHGLSQETAIKIWVTGEIKTWGELLGNGDKTPIHVYTRSDACGAAETWAKWLGKKQEDLGGTAVFGDPGVAAAVQKDVYGIGLNNIGYAYDNETHKPNTGLVVLPIDANNDEQITKDENFYDLTDQLRKAIAEGKYPSPPARDLYLVTKGDPKNPIVREFLKYVLTEGQKKNEHTGYIAITKEKIEKSLSLLQ